MALPLALAVIAHGSRVAPLAYQAATNALGRYTAPLLVGGAVGTHQIAKQPNVLDSMGWQKTNQDFLSAQQSEPNSGQTQAGKTDDGSGYIAKLLDGRPPEPPKGNGPGGPGPYFYLNLAGGASQAVDFYLRQNETPTVLGGVGALGLGLLFGSLPAAMASRVSLDRAAVSGTIGAMAGWKSSGENKASKSRDSLETIGLSGLGAGIGAAAGYIHPALGTAFNFAAGAYFSDGYSGIREAIDRPLRHQRFLDAAGFKNEEEYQRWQDRHYIIYGD